MTGRLCSGTRLTGALVLCLLAPTGALAQGDDGDASATARSLTATPSLNPLSAIMPAQMTQFLGRPLFTASRRPYSAPAAVAPPQPAAAPVVSAGHIRLIGTVRRPDGSSALIQDTRRNVTESVGEGGLVDGWRVTKIDQSSVRIEQAGQTLDLAMFKPAPPPAPGSPPVATTAQTGSPSGQPAPGTASPPATASAPSLAPGAAPPGTVPGTAAAELAATSPYRLTFGSPPPPKAP